MKFTLLTYKLQQGESTGTFEIKDGLGRMKGEVVDVPKLSAPGFIKVSHS